MQEWILHAINAHYLFNLVIIHQEEGVKTFSLQICSGNYDSKMFNCDIGDESFADEKKENNKFNHYLLLHILSHILCVSMLQP